MAGVLGRVRDFFFGAPPPARSTERRSHYDAAKTTDENKRHWAEADSLTGSSALTPGVRATLRDRARYEARNNSFLAGCVRTLVNDTVGRGPRLQMLTPDAGLNRAVEDLWRLWAAAADWGLNVRIMAGVRYVAGECFALPFDSKRMERLGQPVTLGMKLIEPDQVADPLSSYLARKNGDDGVECDENGEVSAYKILKAHPGDLRMAWVGLEADRVPAESVVHWFQPERPNQLRGVTPLAPALPIFGQLRRFTTATLTAAEVAAMLAGVLELPDSQMGTSDGDDAAQFETMDTIQLVRGMLLTVPGGGKVTQFKPEQPTTNYDTFVRAKLKEAGRCINVPYGRMAGDYTSHTYSGGRLEEELYWGDREIERDSFRAKVLDPWFFMWLDFARFALPALAAFRGKWWELKHAWQYDARPTSDPVKDATGDELNLTNGTDTLADIAAREGLTEDELLDKRAATMQKFQERGLPLPPWLTGTPAAPRPGDGQPQNPADAKAVEVLNA